MKPSAALPLQRYAVREAPERFRAANPRVFGSALHGDDDEHSDLDILVDALPGATLFDLEGLQVELEEILQRPLQHQPDGVSSYRSRDTRLDQVDDVC